MRDLGPVQTRCPCLVLGNGRHWSEHSFLLVSEQTSEHRAQARALPPGVVLRHLSRARELV